MSQSGKLKPNFDQQRTELINLSVLQRIDSFIEQILMTATHVALYGFNIESNQWSRKDVEGSLFVVKRNTQPRFQFIVMNRRIADDNPVENLLGDFEFEINVPYILYKNASQEVNGIWFYDRRECEDVANLFNRILNAYSKVPPKPQISSSKGEFEELEAVPTMAVMEGPLEPSPNTNTVTDVPEDSSFINFFSAAMNIASNTSNVTNPGTAYHPSANVPLCSRPPSVFPFPAPTPSTPLHDTTDNSNRVTNLVKPSFFSPASSLMAPPPISSTPTTMLYSPLNLQRPYGAPVLQPFPPPTPSPSLTPSSNISPSYGLGIDRDKVREALLNIVQDNQFIDIFYQALKNAHHS